MTTQIRFQPTLFLFLGTSAGQVGYRLKEQLQKAYGDIPVLRFLWVDIDTDIEPRARPYFSAHERVELSGLNPSAVIKNINNYPAIQEWWPETTRVRAGMLAGGGAPQQMRLIARLALFRMYNDRTRGPALIDRLQMATEALFEIDNIRATEAKSTEQMQFTVEPGCRVVIVFSPCGGTGSAISFDLAYLSRSLLQGKNPTIMSINVLPPVIDKAIQSETQTQKDKIRANTYAWFREDNYLSENPYWHVQYPEGAVVEVDAPPFDYRFVVDIENQAGYRLNSIDDVNTMIAQAVFMDTGSSIAGAIRGFTANVHALGDLFEGARRSFSSLAASSLIFPKERLLNYCGVRMGRRLLQEGFLANPKPHDVSVAVSAILSQLELRDTVLLPTLIEKAQIKMFYETSIKKADSVASAITQIDAQETQNQSARRTELEKMKQVGRDRYAEIAVSFEQEITKIAAVKGVSFAIAVLAQLGQAAPVGGIDPNVPSIDGLKSRVLQNGAQESDMEIAHKNFEKAREAVKKLDDGPEDVIERMINGRGWKKKFSLFKRDSLNAMGKVSEVQIELAAQKQVVEIYDRLASLVDVYQTKLSASKSHLSQVVDDLAAKADKLANITSFNDHRYEFLQEVEIDFEDYYQTHAHHIQPETSFQNMIPEKATADLAGFTAWIQDAIKTAVEAHAKHYFVEDLDAISILDVLHDLAEKQERPVQKVIEEHITHLVEYCHPFWQFDKDRGLNDLEGKSIIGVEDEQYPFLPETYRNGTLYEIKTTGFKDRIDVVRIHHGLPAFLLRGMDEYKMLYERKRRGIDPLHILPGMEFAPDLMPEQDVQSRETFAIGLAFDYVIQIGTWYYFDPDQGYTIHKIQPTREFRLGQGRENSEASFVHREDWVRKVEQKVEREIRDIGNEAAIQKLDEFIVEHQQKIAKMNSEDTLRKQYEKEIDAFRNLQQRLGKID